MNERINHKPVCRTAPATVLLANSLIWIHKFNYLPPPLDYLLSGPPLVRVWPCRFHRIQADSPGNGSRPNTCNRRKFGGDHISLLDDKYEKANTILIISKTINCKRSKFFFSPYRQVVHDQLIKLKKWKIISKNPAYGIQRISRPMRIVAPMP